MLLRPAEADDAVAVARVHVRSWQVGYRALLPAQYLAGLEPEDRARRYTFGSPDPRQPATIVAECEHVICGFATTAPANDEQLPGFGLLAALYVDPAHWGFGIGRTLLHAACAQLRERGFSHAVLWVMTGNSRARRFYENDGWQADGTQRRHPVWGIVVEDMRYRRAL